MHIFFFLWGATASAYSNILAVLGHIWLTATTCHTPKVRLATVAWVAVWLRIEVGLATNQRNTCHSFLCQKCGEYFLRLRHQTRLPTLLLCSHPAVTVSNFDSNGLVGNALGAIWFLVENLVWTRHCSSVFHKRVGLDALNPNRCSTSSVSHSDSNGSQVF
jgi:hypothetical protein